MWLSGLQDFPPRITVKIKVGTLFIPKRVCILSRYSLVLTCVISLETCPVPQMRGPTTQTSRDPDRGGRQDKIWKKHPQPSPRKTNKTDTEQKTPTRKLEKRQKVEDSPQSPGKTARNINNYIECNRDVQIIYPRRCLEIQLRSAGTPVQTR